MIFSVQGGQRRAVARRAHRNTEGRADGGHGAIGGEKQQQRSQAPLPTLLI